MRRLRTTIATSAIAAALLAAVSVPALAQATLNEAIAGRAQSGSGQDRLLVDAKEIVYDNDKNTIAASGDVQMNYQGRTLQADRVTYDRNTGRVFAEGNARLTDASGTVATGDRFELTDDFKNGFIDSLRVVQTTVEQGRPLTTRFSAPRAERAEGETTTFERGTYTACEPCKDNPERPPLWQVKAAKIIHNNSERTIYYEDATLELLGIPVAYLPYFWTPDPTVKRKTGFLSPRYVYSTALGYGGSVPFFWAIAPNYDLTISPTFLSRQGVLGQAEWRHRLENGTYNIRAAGIFQQEPDAFLPPPYGAGNRDFRGSLETNGLFYINQNWRWGWDIALLSDKWFLTNYKIRSESLSSYYIKESISTLYLQGQGDRSFFDVRGYYFQTLSSSEWQKQQPIVAPVLDYNKRFTPSSIGGEAAIDVNVTHISREAAQFDPLSIANTTYFGVAQTCIVFDPASCLVRGISGTTSRASVMASWRREFVDPIGQVWTPFAYVRADNIWIDPDFKGYQNAQLGNFLDSDDDFVFRGMPAVGVEYRYPFVASLGTSGKQILEPIAQVIARPNETRIGSLPNEDAQSLVFDDTSLFDWDKFSGYDRVEGGVRANVGIQYTVTGADDFYANVLFGQSYQIAGRNSFRQPDLANVGLDSGLDSRASDYVGRFQISPNANFALVTRARFDQEDFDVNRIEAGFRANFNPYLPLSTSLTYANYAAQPAIGFPLRREGLLGSARWDISPNWYVTGSVLLDLDRYLLARETYLAQLTTNPNAVYESDNTAYVSGMSLGLGYMDECTTFSVSYSVTPREVVRNSGEKNQNHTIAFSLEFRSLGEVGYTQNLSGTSDE
ncbi:LPS-assembly protein LptD [Microvirga terrae]|uniref:LPS-assembly protein LptD n=1 Tax=Microvirga terrae TaxID=2740529 RepID=A0ABY5RLD3_9HYPH|nr:MULTISPECIES: LPS-assembly protein LptD [Microvirga]MBQ0820629.1 LPS-assembly protein LptD [Microvirga sp. HBU67558]UVF18015.1 LPS-assembly protein LptD [Microvirga terrae]